MPGPVEFNTPARVIREALYDAKLLQQGDEPSGERLATCLNRLNDLVNLWQTQGIKLWLNKVTPVALVAGTPTYTFGPAGSGAKRMRVIQGWYRDSNGVDRPLDPLSWESYNSLSNKLVQGTVNGYFVDKQAANLAVTLWQVPDATAALGTVQLLMQEPIYQAVSLTETMIFPNEWYMALHWGLADEICTGQPGAIVQRCEQRAKMYREALEDWDVEDAPTFFTPSSEGSTSNFR